MLEKIFSARVSSSQLSRADELEQIRVAVINNFANWIKDWLNNEVQLSTLQGGGQFAPTDLLQHEPDAAARHTLATQELYELRTLRELATRDLNRIARATKLLTDTQRQRFTPLELQRLDAILNPPAPREIYGIAD
ncbi:MAG: hypothetical protein EBZ48_01710 [Proteobacteria bacterium]|nr:hypothetical protein [Pseudomonadota bacterium]